MITSLFNKSKPINSMAVVVFITLVFVITDFSRLFFDLPAFINGFSRWVISVFLVFLLGFIISKNKLVQGNGYAIMTFGLLIFMLPQSLKYSDLLLSNLCILFALRRLLSLYSNKHLKKKFFDAGFWIALATLFYFWAFLFFALVIVALIYHSQNDFKNIIIPFVGAATLLLLLVTYNIVMKNTLVEQSNFLIEASLDFTPYNTYDYIIKFTVLFTAIIWTLIYFFKTLPDKNKKQRPSYFLIAWATVLAMLVAVISPNKNGSEFIFLFAPFSIVMANYIQVITERWFREVFTTLFILTPIICLLL